MGRGGGKRGRRISSVGMLTGGRLHCNVHKFTTFVWPYSPSCVFASVYWL